MLDLNWKEQDDIWSIADLDDLQRTTDLARHALGVSTAMLRTVAADGDSIRHLSGDPLSGDPSVPQAAGAESAADQPTMVPAARLDAPLIVAGWPALGVLSVVATGPRDWTETDRATLRGLAKSLAELLVARCRAAERHGEAAEERLPLAPQMRPALGRALRSIVDLTDLLKADRSIEMVGARAQAIRTIAEDVQRALETASVAGDVAGGPAEGREQAAAETVEGEMNAGAGGLSARILLADDLDLNRKLISDMLAIEGHVVDSVADGAAAVKAAGEGDYDLILMDMIMPGMDGVAAARAIRALPAPAGDVPIVALTAHSLSEQLDNCLQAGMNALLTKPMSLDALTSAVATWTRTHGKAA